MTCWRRTRWPRPFSDASARWRSPIGTSCGGGSPIRSSGRRIRRRSTNRTDSRHVAQLRAAVARRGSDAAASALVERLHAASGEFTRIWDRHEVAVERTGRMKVVHPEVGPIEFDTEALLTPAEDQRLVVFTPPPGTGSIESLDLLRVIGPETAHRSHR
ncbi:hypothetical protein ACFQY7_39235 [Actinomadura luteofluorescens]|uniref:MmyB family transcriptional regulator n=1 Tax=Actinomadura luteofluorescens TaxID=46163 RepID=UPI0036303C64